MQKMESKIRELEQRQLESQRHEIEKQHHMRKVDENRQRSLSREREDNDKLVNRLQDEIKMARSAEGLAK